MFIKALSVEQVGDGMYRLTIPSKDFTIEESLLLEKLFPHLREEAQVLLNKEAMLEAIPTMAEVRAAEVSAYDKSVTKKS